ncbi:aminoglycoside phosphotransferase family protein [Streptomyces sp. NPDC004111]|uniref:aminoglycoside phosphotransferase family protein n=1 Tax=Streptomyces sp. NPDC004111 TaxID=3364690 RepID=UPI00367DB8B9
MIRVPEEFARATVAREGEAGRDWLATLPGLLSALLERWNRVPAAPATHGQVGVVLPVRRAGADRRGGAGTNGERTGEEGADAVLKVSFPHPGNDHEPDALAAWAGHGAVTLLRRDDAHYAMLLERAGPASLATLADTEEAITRAGRLARRLAVPAPPGPPRLSDATGEWAEQLRKDADRLPDPLPAYLVDAALATLDELGPDQPDTFVHGDLHFANVLRSHREPWLAIDPKGLVGDPAYDSLTLLRTRPAELLAAADPGAAVLRRLAVFADAAEVDRERARRWAQFRAVEAAHWGRAHGEPAELVRLTDALAALLT